MGLELDKAFNAHRDKTREEQRGTCMSHAHDITKKGGTGIYKRGFPGIMRETQLGITGRTLCRL